MGQDDDVACVAHVIPRGKRPYGKQKNEGSVLLEKYEQLGEKLGAGLLMTSLSGWEKEQLSTVGQLMRHADAAVVQHDWGQAECSFLKVTELAPQFCGGHEGLGASLVNQARHPEAEACLTHACRLYKACLKANEEDEARCLVLLAQAKAGVHKWSEAIAMGTQAVELDPSSKGPRTALERHRRFARLLGEAQEPRQPEPCLPSRLTKDPASVVYTRDQSDDDSETEGEDADQGVHDGHEHVG